MKRVIIHIHYLFTYQWEMLKTIRCLPVSQEQGLGNRRKASWLLDLSLV